MTDLIVGIGLVFVIEGLLWAAFPDFARRLAATALETPDSVLRIAGAIAIAVGVLVVYLVRA